MPGTVRSLIKLFVPNSALRVRDVDDAKLVSDFFRLNKGRTSMKRFKSALLLAIFVALGTFGKTSFATDPVEQAIAACEYELTHFCSSVTPGEVG